MVKINKPNIQKDFRKRFSKFLSGYGNQFSELKKAILAIEENSWTVFVFGGVPRGVFDDGSTYRPRDFDLVFDSRDFSCFEKTFSHHVVKKNRFGGLQLRIGHLAVDAWSLESTWAFQQGHIATPTFEALPKTTFLNLDGIVIELTPKKGKGRRIFDEGFFKAWHDKTLDVNLVANPFPALCLVRSLHIARRFGFKISHRLVIYILEQFEQLSMEDLQSAQISHYGLVDFEVNELNEIRSRLEKYLSEEDHQAVAVFPVRPDQLEFGFHHHGFDLLFQNPTARMREQYKATKFK